MARIELLASVGYDRIWWLDGPLRSGARLRCSRQEMRLGGGGYYTSGPLLRAGHQVSLVAIMPDCDATQNCLADMRALGMDTSRVVLSDDEPTSTDILVEPDGERTILFRGTAGKGRLSAELSKDSFVYVNSRRLDEDMLRQLAAHDNVIGQYSSILQRQFPARVLIASVADHPIETPVALFERAAQSAGPKFEAVILTAGTEPVVIVERGTITSLEVTPCDVASDTIGAGDTFAGGVIHALAQGSSIVDAARCGMKEASLHLEKRSDARPAA